MKVANADAVAAAIRRRHAELAALLSSMNDKDLHAGSLLPGWNRLTVICHLRYGAEATLSMTRSVLAGQAASFYPHGRSTQRPLTLRPRAGERPHDVVNALAASSKALDELWASLNEDQWHLDALEPPDNVDLGPTTIGFLALLRLTEVEVHGSDLDVGASAWSDVFVDTAFPLRVHWLTARRSNHTTSAAVLGSWVLRPHDAAPYSITATEDGVSISERNPSAADAEIAGSKRELLSFLIGRTSLDALSVRGDQALASEFTNAFPPP